MMEPFEWTEPSSVEDTIPQLSERRVLKAGGMDLLDLMKEGLSAPERLVSLRRIAGLDRIELSPQGDLLLGPRVTLAQLAASDQVREHAAALHDAAGHAATPQSRNMATLGGNLLQRPRCWYFRSADFICKKNGGNVCFAQHGENQYHAVFDNAACAMVHPSSPSTALTALDAKVELRGPKGGRVVPIEDFFVSPEEVIETETVRRPDEMIVGIRMATGNKRKSAYIKQGQRESFDWPLVDVAVSWVPGASGGLQDVRVVLGAVAPAPRRARGAEALLEGQRLDEATAAAAGEAALAGATPLAKNGYKLRLIQTLVRRALMAAAEKEAT